MTNDCLVDAGDLPITRGNNFPPVGWQFLDSENPDHPLSITGNTFRLTIKWKDGQIVVSEASGLAIDTTQSVVTWNYTLEQSRLLPAGRLAQYELERRFGTSQQSVIRGFFAVSEGLNPDE